MTTTGVDSFDETIQTTDEWLKDLMFELNLEDRRNAYQALRATLQTLRDRIPVDEAAHLGSQLPMLIRGFYYDGWKPAATPDRDIDRTAFLSNIQEAVTGELEGENPETIARAVFKLMHHRIASGKIEDVRNTLPPDIKELWPRKV